MQYFCRLYIRNISQISRIPAIILAAWGPEFSFNQDQNLKNDTNKTVYSTTFNNRHKTNEVEPLIKVLKIQSRDQSRSHQ